MKSKKDLEYIISNLGNLSGIPSRIFKNNQKIMFYSVIDFIKDPLDLDLESILEIKEDISYYQNKYGFNYAIINYNDYKIVIGPTSEIKISTKEIISYGFDLGIPPSFIDEFINKIYLIVNFPLMSLLQIMCVVYFSLTNRKKTLEDITIHINNQNHIKDEIEKESIAKRSNNINGPYNALDFENKMLDMVMRGDTFALKEFFKNAQTIRSGIIAKDQLRQAKNIFIVTSTLVSRAAIKGGLDVTNALALSDSYIQKCELSNDIKFINELSYQMVINYSEKVEELKLGTSPSILVNKVSNYIQNHLFEQIKTIDIAKNLFIGRSRLSTNFKKETGMNISDYISTQKINESKRLLRYSNKSLTEISGYLGFRDPSHFSKVFKKYCNTTPFEYRQLHRH